MQTRSTDPKTTRRNPGDRPIPGFQLVRPRGSGGFGEVWEAEASGGFRVALKFVRLSNRALASEMRALEFVRGIHHPNLLASFGAWKVDDTLIIGMELGDRSLWDRYIEAANRGLSGIPRGELLGYLSEVAAGLTYLNDYCHTLDGRTGVGVQHRDLKPSNILLFGGGAKVADLGMARAMEGEVAGHTGVWTYSYAAPEFFRGETTRQSDQYSLAVTYCQLRTGHLPFEGNAASVTAGHLFGQPDLEALPGPERPIVERALSKKPGDRWPDCRSFAEALRAIPRDQVPDELIAPDDFYDIPRELHSSTGTGLGTGSGPTGGRTGDSAWSEFAPAGDPKALAASSTGSFDLFADFAPPASHDSRDQVKTQVLPPAAIEPDPPVGSTGPTPEVAPEPEPSGRWGRTGRKAAVAMVAALALLTAGVHHPAPHDHVPTPDVPRPPDPALIVGSGFGSAAELALDPAPPSPAPVDKTPTPLPASPAPTRTSLKPVEPEPGPELEPIPEPKPEPEPEPAPAPPAPASPAAAPSATSPTPPLVVDIPQVGPTIRSDLTPAPRDRAAGQARRTEVETPAAPAEVRPVEVPVRAASPAPAPPRNPAPALLALNRGLEFLARDAFTPALAEFDESIRLDPGKAAGYLSRALARHRAGYPRSAMADYDEAIRLRPLDADAHIARGQAHHDLGAFDRAIADYGEAIRLRPGDADPWFRRGMARYRSGDYAGSIPDFTETLRLDPKKARASEFRADAQERLGSPTGRPAAPGAGPTRPAPAPSTTPATAPVPGGSSAVLPTVRVVVPGPTAAPNPSSPPRRPPPRRLLPWPWPKAR